MGPFERIERSRRTVCAGVLGCAGFLGGLAHAQIPQFAALSRSVYAAGGYPATSYRTLGEPRIRLSYAFFSIKQLQCQSAGGPVWMANDGGRITFGGCVSARGLPWIYSTSLVSPLPMADLDGDGDTDAVVPLDPLASIAAKWGHYVFLNDGRGKLGSIQLLPSGQGEGVAIGDLDGDGDRDLFFSSSGTLLYELFLNDGKGSFADASHTLPKYTGIPTFVPPIELVDLDADRDLDVVGASVDRSQ